MKELMSENQVLERQSDFGVLVADNGDKYEMYLPETARSRVSFENEYCEFTPVGWIRDEGLWYPLGYKVVTDDMRSLGLRKNPNIMKFAVGKWIEVEDGDLLPGEADWGGVWSALRKGSIKTLKNHCLSTWNMRTRGFLTAIKEPVFANTYRIKSKGVKLLGEITS